MRMWVDLHSIPGAHPLARLIRRRAYKRFVSPTQRIAVCAQGPPLKELEVNRPYISAPWDARLDTTNSVDYGVQAAVQAQQTQGIRVATGASAKNQMVGIGGGRRPGKQ